MNMLVVVVVSAELVYHKIKLFFLGRTKGRATRRMPHVGNGGGIIDKPRPSPIATISRRLWWFPPPCWVPHSRISQQHSPKDCTDQNVANTGWIRDVRNEDKNTSVPRLVHILGSLPRTFHPHPAHYRWGGKCSHHVCKYWSWCYYRFKLNARLFIYARREDDELGV